MKAPSPINSDIAEVIQSGDLTGGPAFDDEPDEDGEGFMLDAPPSKTLLQAPKAAKSTRTIIRPDSAKRSDAPIP